MVQGPIAWGMPGILTASVLKMSWSSQKSMHGLALPFSAPQSYELAISRMKRGGVEFIVAGCILLASPVWSVPLASEHQHWLPHTPSPSTLNFSPLIQQGHFENIWRIAQSFLFTQPRGVSTVCHWAGGRQFTLHGTSSVSLLSRVCSSRAVRVHWAHIACMTIQRGVPSTGVMRKSQFWWRTHKHPVCWFFMRYKGTPSATWCSTSYGSFSHQSFTFLFPL